MTISHAPAITYQSYDGDLLTLYPWSGSNIALLTSSSSLNTDVIEKIVDKLDTAFDIYSSITAKLPTAYKQYNGLNSIAQVPTAFNGNASAIGWLGATGIEITDGSFHSLYSGVETNNVYDQTLFYELGRNFWFYGAQLGAVDSFVTGFAIVNRFISMEKSEAIGAPFGNMSFYEFKTSILEDLRRNYFSDPNYTLSSTLGANTGVANNFGWGAADFAASLMYEIYEDFDFETYSKFFNILGTLPAASSAHSAFQNLMAAASQASGIDYSFLDKAAGASYLAGGRGADSLTASSGGSPTFGFGGDDTITGTGGADRLFGSAGNDRLSGGGASDLLIGGVGNDILFGGPGSDSLYGGDGRDILFGDAGSDTLLGGIGDDLYSVDNSDDVIVELGGQYYDETYSSANYMISDNIETLFLIGTAMYGTGNSGNNAIIGNDVDNVLDAGDGTFEFINGLGGNDLLIGGAGHDEIVGGTGNDVFRFTALADAGDFIYDFTPGQDKLQLSAAAFGIGTASNPLVAGRSFINGPDVTTAAPTLLYTRANGTLFYDADGAGSQAPVVLAVLNGTPALSASDITVY